MAEENKTLEDLGDLKDSAAASNDAPVHVQKLDQYGRAYATGKRKDAIARVWLKPGKGQIQVNAKDFKAYFARPVLQMLLQQPLNAANRVSQYDINVTVMGGGLSGQAGAVRHGISKALTYYEPELRSVLKKGGFLTRDSRTVERKKFGRVKRTLSEECRLLLLTGKRHVGFVDELLDLRNLLRHRGCQIFGLVRIVGQVVKLHRLARRSKRLPGPLTNRLGCNLLVGAFAEFPIQVVMLLLGIVVPLKHGKEGNAVNIRRSRLSQKLGEGRKHVLKRAEMIAR